MGAISAPIDPQPVNTAITANADFSDAGLDDTHTAEWDWGDGVVTQGTVAQGSGSGTVSDSHVYTAAGVYTARLTVSDSDGDMSTSTFQYFVVYDPNAGFVTGGGWIDSPAGAYVADPTLTGKAGFGFVAKYKKGTTVPDGQTQFEFKTGDLKFHSTSYEWLVVAGANAKFKGEGTINGQGQYGFMLTATDGQAKGGGKTDTFRIKIWDKTGGVDGGVVYDNKFGTADDSNAGTALGGGSIVVHNSGSALTGSATAGSNGGTILTQPMLDAAVAEATAGWTASGISSNRLTRLADLDIGIAQFPGNTLGLSSHSTNKIWLDADGGGRGWSVDAGGYDLSSAVSHELGHALGFDHRVMSELLAPGEVHLASDDVQRAWQGIELARLAARRQVFAAFADGGELTGGLGLQTNSLRLTNAYTPTPGVFTAARTQARLRTASKHQLATAEGTPNLSREANAHDAFFGTFDDEVGGVKNSVTKDLGYTGLE